VLQGYQNHVAKNKSIQPIFDPNLLEENKELDQVVIHDLEENKELDQDITKIASFLLRSFSRSYFIRAMDRIFWGFTVINPLDILGSGKFDLHCKIKETLFIQELKPSLNVNISSEKLLLFS